MAEKNSTGREAKLHMNGQEIEVSESQTAPEGDIIWPDGTVTQGGKGRIYFTDDGEVRFVDPDGKEMVIGSGKIEVDGESPESSNDNRRVCPHHYCENWADACEKHGQET